MLITRTEDNSWYFVGNKHAERIITLKIAVDRGRGLEPEYLYDFGVPEVDKLGCTMIIKDGSKMLYEDNNGICAFGIKEVQSPAKGIFVYLRTESMHTFVFGNEKACSADDVHAISSGKEDAISICMTDIFNPTSLEIRTEDGECFNE